MVESWESCFSFAYRYTFLSFLPPFVPSSTYKFGYITLAFSTICFVRCLLIIPLENKKDFEIVFSVIKVGQMFFNTIWFIFKRERFLRFQNEVSDFLRKNQKNPGNLEAETFTNLWDAQKPEKLAKYFFWSLTLPGAGWIFQSYFTMILDSDNVTHSPTLFYSPGFANSVFHKWFYTAFDSLATLSLLAQIIHADLVIIVLLSFSRSQFLYLKNLLDEIFKGDSKRRNDDVNKTWISLHHQVFSLWDELHHLLRPHIAINYLSQVGVVVFNILAVMEKNTNQSFVQKIMVTAVMSSLLCVLGYQCGIVEEIMEIHSYMYSSLLKVETVQGNLKEIFFLKMLILRCQRPIRVSGYGLFNLSRKDYKDVCLNIYKFYSSLVSVKSKHGRHQS